MVTLHNPFPNVNQIVSIDPGIVKYDNANEIGLQSIEKIVGLTFHKIRVLQLSTVSSFLKVHDCNVYHCKIVDCLLLFQRICLQKFNEHCEYLQYKLSPYPTALFNAGMQNL